MLRVQEVPYVNLHMVIIRAGSVVEYPTSPPFRGVLLTQALLPRFCSRRRGTLLF